MTFVFCCVEQNLVWPYIRHFLCADDVHIGKHLLKTMEHCLVNEAVPNTKIELFHHVHQICGENAPHLMND